MKEIEGLIKCLGGKYPEYDYKGYRLKKIGATWQLFKIEDEKYCLCFNGDFVRLIDLIEYIDGLTITIYNGYIIRYKAYATSNLKYFIEKDEHTICSCKSKKDCIYIIDCLIKAEKKCEK